MNTVKIISTQRVAIKEVATNVIKVCAPIKPSTIKIVTAGPQGPSGDAQSSYIHQQQVPSATWVINHNLGLKPSVELLNSGSQEIEGDVIHTSVNQVIVAFTSPITGLARLI